ncbi:MAG: methyltransferase family protein [Promethearchaeota archaeon]
MVSEANEKEKITYGELPHTHLYHALGNIFFFTVWILDSFIFEYSTFLQENIDWFIRIPIGMSIMLIGFIISGIAHYFKFNKKLPGVIDTSVYSISRHPMYLGYILAYLGAILSTLSLLSFIPWIFILIINNKMANYEEKKLIEVFGDNYIEYQNKVPKWMLI